MTIEECEQLIGQLSHCKLPFQCAHGRPTAMPLLNLSQLTKMPQSVMEVRYDLLCCYITLSAAQISNYM